MKQSAGKPCWAWVSVARVNRRQACRHPCHPCRYPCHRRRAVALRVRDVMVRPVAEATSKPSLAGEHTHPEPRRGRKPGSVLASHRRRVAARARRVRRAVRRRGVIGAVGRVASWRIRPTIGRDPRATYWAEGECPGACAQVGVGFRASAAYRSRGIHH